MSQLEALESRHLLCISDTGFELLQAFEKQHLHKTNTGSEGHLNSIEELAEFLRVCSKCQRSYPKWNPPSATYCPELVDAADSTVATLSFFEHIHFLFSLHPAQAW